MTERVFALQIYNWLINVADELIRTHCDLGVNPSTAGEFLELHKQMLNDVRVRIFVFHVFHFKTKDLMLLT